MPLPRPLPFGLRFSPLPGTKKSAVRQPDHFKWKFVKCERPVLFERGQFKDELGAVGRWFGRADRVGVEGEVRSVSEEEARNGMKKARELAALNEDAWMDAVTESETKVGTVGPGGKVKTGKKKKELMKEALIRKAAKIREEKMTKKKNLVEGVDGDTAEGIEGKGEKMQVKEVGQQKEDDYDHNKYKKVKATAGHKQRIRNMQVLSLKSEWLKKAKAVDEAYWEPFGDIIVPLEKTTRIPNGDGEGKDAVKFERFEAPLFVFLAWNKRKLRDPETYQPNIDLYLAQYSLSDLPKELREDLPTPNLIREGGQGLVASSLWMGVPPTDTPLHKDPNPNFFVQLAGHKRIRMIRPEDGDLAYSTVRNIIADETGVTPFAGAFVNSTFTGLGGKLRGNEMMSGLEKKLMDSLIWGDDHGVWSWENGQKVNNGYKIASGKWEFVPDNEKVNETSEEADVKEEAGTTEGSSASEVVDANEEASTDKDKKTPRKKGHYVLSSSKALPLFKGFEVELGPGDGCYIPMGWWHSLRGIPEKKIGINASVNWWFHQGKAKKSIREGRRRKYLEEIGLNAEERERLGQRVMDDGAQEGEESWDDSIERARRKLAERQRNPYAFNPDAGRRGPRRKISDVERDDWVDQPWAGRGSNPRENSQWKPNSLRQQEEEGLPEPKIFIRKWQSGSMNTDGGIRSGRY